MNTIEEIVKKWQYKDGYVHIPDMIKEIEKHEDKVVKDLHDISGVQIKEREREAVEKYIRRNYKELSEMYGDKNVVDAVVENELYELQQQKEEKDE